MPFVRVRETASLSNLRAMAKDAPGFLLRTALQVGTAFRVGVGPVTLSVVADPDMLRTVLQRGAKTWGRGSALDPIRPLLGNGLPMSDPPLWLTQRRTMQPSFHRSHAPQWVPVMREAVEKRLEALRDGAQLSMRGLMMSVTRDVIVQAMFSQSLGSDTQPFDDAFATVETYAGNAAFPLHLPRWLPTPTNIRFKRAVTFLHNHIQRVVDERRRVSSPPNDLLTLLIRARDPETGDAMSDVQLRDEVMNIFFAGHETTANLLTWTVFLLSQHPKVLSRAEAEVESVLGARAPENDDLPRLTYLSWIVREALRLYPPAWMFARQSFEPQELGGEAFDVGAVVLVSPYVTQRLPSLWDNPNDFIPERFEREQSTDAAVWKYAYLPFGAGPHVCIGNHFALLEAATVLSMLIQRGRFAVLRPEAVRAKVGATLFVGNDLPVQFTARRVAA